MLDHGGPLSTGQMKRNAALAALDFVETGSVVGIGSGSTAWEFITALAQNGPEIAGAVPASLETAHRLAVAGIPLLDLAGEFEPSLYVDGADEIDMQGRAIKGAGAAHTAEKRVASASRYWACVVDATKVVNELSSFVVPLEVEAWAIAAVTDAIAVLGGEARLRCNVLADAGNPLLDAHGLSLADPMLLEDALDAIPGVVGNGIFAHRTADVIIVGRASGGVSRIVPSRSHEPW